MRIAIWAQSADIRQALAAAVRQAPEAGEVCLYAEAEALQRALRENPPDAVLIALVPDAAAGFAQARQVRALSLECDILFAADTAAYTAEAMEYRAAGYLLLPADPAAIRRMLQMRRVRRQAVPARYVVHTRLSDRLVSREKIRYFHSEGHYALVHVAGEAEPLVHLKRLDDIGREMAPQHFLRCHQSYLVNPAWIDRADSRHVYLTDGTELPVSRRYTRAVAAFVRGINTTEGSAKTAEETAAESV